MHLTFNNFEFSTIFKLFNIMLDLMFLTHFYDEGETFDTFKIHSKNLTFLE